MWPRILQGSVATFTKIGVGVSCESLIGDWVCPKITASNVFASLYRIGKDLQLRNLFLSLSRNISMNATMLRTSKHHNDDVDLKLPLGAWMCCNLLPPTDDISCIKDNPVRVKTQNKEKKPTRSTITSGVELKYVCLF